jgi:hypothetical protein
MTPEIKQYQDIKQARAIATRRNAGLRMAGKASQQQALPELPQKPVKYLLEEPDGTYAGIEYDKERAYEYAEEHGMIVKVLPYDAA